MYRPSLEAGQGASRGELRAWRPLGEEGAGEKAESGAKRLWGILWFEKWFLLGCAVVCATVALVSSFFQTPLYKAKTSLEIEDLNDRFLQLNEVDPVVKGGNSDAYLSTQVDLLSSGALLTRVIERLHLEEAYRTTAPPSFWQGLKEKVKIAQPPLSARELALGDVRNNLEITAPRGSSRVVTIEYTASDPHLAANFPNTLAQEFIEQGVELRIQSAHALNTWLSKEVEQSRQKLQSSEEALQQYGQSAGLLFTDDKNSVAGAKLAQLQDELSKAQAERMLKQSNYELISKASPDALAQMVGNGPFQEYQVKLTDLRRQLAEAQALMTPSHYKVKQLAAQVAEMESAIAAQQKETANRLAGEYGAAQRRESLLQQAYTQQARLVSGQDAKASRYNVLKNEVETNRQLYASMLQRMKGVSVASAMRASNIAIFDPAEVPSRPYKPKPMLNAAIGLMSGLLLGTSYLFLRTSWDRSLRIPGQIGSYLNVPELGAVPSVEKRFSAPAKKRPPRLAAGEPVISEQRGIEYTMIRDHFAKGFRHLEGSSQIADSFRAILASIILSKDRDQAPHVIVLTSPSAQEGKTTSAVNLAVALASISKEVLLIDSDLRKPRLHEIFNIPNERGFSDLLVEQEQPEKAQVSHYLQATKIAGLSIMPSGRNRALASNLLYGPWLSDLFAKLRRTFDAVIIDTPPLLLVADARLLARSADGVVVVCRAGTTNLEKAKVAVDRLQGDGAHVIGTILNDFDPRLSSYYGKYDQTYSARPV